MNNEMTLMLQATMETLTMTLLSGGISFILGIPLGIVLFLTGTGQFLQNRFAHKALGIIVNIGRSIPFIILMVAIIPFTRLLTGSSIGTAAAIVPLTLSAIPFVARITEGAIAEVPYGLTEAANAMGASSFQIVYKVLLPEALPSLIHGATLTLVTLVGYTAMAGTIGGGGLGSLAINYGYQRFDVTMMASTVIILVVIVQAIQWAGEKLQRRCRH